MSLSSTHSTRNLQNLPRRLPAHVERRWRLFNQSIDLALAFGRISVLGDCVGVVPVSRMATLKRGEGVHVFLKTRKNPCVAETVGYSGWVLAVDAVAIRIKATSYSIPSGRIGVEFGREHVIPWARIDTVKVLKPASKSEVAFGS